MWLNTAIWGNNQHIYIIYIYKYIKEMDRNGKYNKYYLLDYNTW